MPMRAGQLRSLSGSPALSGHEKVGEFWGSSQHLSISGVANAAEPTAPEIARALPLTSERDLYISLMRQGVSTAAAPRIVGVNRKTGHRWRYGRSITVRTGEIRTYPAITRPTHRVSAL
jgi:hypothetical protein